MRTLPVTLAMLCLLPASRGHAQRGEALGNPTVSLPSARHLFVVERARTPDERVLSQAQARRLRLRRERARERLRDAMGDLLTMSALSLQREREHVGRQLEISGSLTAIGATGIVGGLLMGLIPLDCSSRGSFSIGPSCDSNSAWLGAGLFTAIASAITMIASAVWLGQVDRRRRRVERAMRPKPLALDLRIGAHGAIGTAAVRF